MSEEPKDWYSNKQLFEKIQELRTDLQETRVVVKKYNNIRKDLNSVMERLTAIEERKVGRNEAGEFIREWGGWIIALILFLLKLSEFL